MLTWSEIFSWVEKSVAKFSCLSGLWFNSVVDIITGWWATSCAGWFRTSWGRLDGFATTTVSVIRSGGESETLMEPVLVEGPISVPSIPRAWGSFWTSQTLFFILGEITRPIWPSKTSRGLWIWLTDESLEFDPISGEAEPASTVSGVACVLSIASTSSYLLLAWSIRVSSCPSTGIERSISEEVETLFWGGCREFSFIGGFFLLLLGAWLAFWLWPWSLNCGSASPEGGYTGCWYVGKVKFGGW